MTKQEQLKKLDMEITTLRSQRAALFQEIQAERYDVKVGDTVEYEGKQYKIWRFEEFWPLGKPIKRDGSLGMIVKHLYDFPKAQVKGESK